MMCYGFGRRDRSDAWWYGGEGDTDWRDRRDEIVATEPEKRSSRDPDLRVSQAERDEVAAALARHYAEGRLTIGEYEERVAVALEAKTGRELGPLLADLPADRRAGDRRGRDRPGGGATGEESTWPSHRVVARVVAVAAVVLLAASVGLWALWLLWPALVLTGGCRHARRHDVRSRGARYRRPPAIQRL
jgi:Domain of unknown function (DUF1707)